MTRPAPFWRDDAVTIWQADARRLPLDDDTVDLVVTSPPYFGLRSYTDGGEHYAGQIGDEPTPTEFLDALLDVTAECVRVLKPSGSLWVNLGDKYARPGGGADTEHRNRNLDGIGRGASQRRPTSTEAAGGIPEKSLMGLPWRYALRCVDELGLILRAEVVWSKPNGLPESVTDRVRRSHEQWFHFTLRPRYFSAVDAIREPHMTPGVGGPRRLEGAAFAAAGRIGSADGSRHTDGNPLGKLPGSVWEIATQPLRVPAELGVDHFAAFPMEWPRRIIRGWSPSGVCVDCGEGRRPVVVKDGESTYAKLGKLHAQNSDATRYRDEWNTVTANGTVPHFERRDARIVGEACGCPEPTAATRPAVVLDPFGGTGTTGLVARALGRRAHLVDLSADYCRLARWRVTDPGELARALEVEKPPAAPEGMASLLDLLDEGATA